MAQHPEGVGAERLTAAMEGMPRRTLQRRLAVLVQAGRLDLVGLGRAACYVVSGAPPVSSLTPVFLPLSVQEPGTDYPTEAYVPTSPGGEAIKAYVRQPRHLRKPRRALLRATF